MAANALTPFCVRSVFNAPAGERRCLCACFKSWLHTSQCAGDRSALFNVQADGCSRKPSVYNAPNPVRESWKQTHTATQTHTHRLTRTHTRQSDRHTQKEGMWSFSCWTTAKHQQLLTCCTHCTPSHSHTPFWKVGQMPAHKPSLGADMHVNTPVHTHPHTHTLQETYLNKRVAHRQTVHLIKMSLICKQCIHLQEQQCSDTDEGLNTHQNHRFVSWQVCECVLCLCSLFVLFVFSLADVHYMHKLKCEVRLFCKMTS